MKIFKPIWDSPRGRSTFAQGLKQGARILDVGCGNNSPAWFKAGRPDLYYVGLDVGDYNQNEDVRMIADEYMVTGPEGFAAAIESFSGQMDAVVSSHNLEHCDEPERCLTAMAASLKSNGRLYLSFPCEESVGFPKRAGCLNLFDDATHKAAPAWLPTVEVLKKCGCLIDFQAKRYRPFPQWLKGLLLEPLSSGRRAVIEDGSTWALYGFESVIWARKQ